MQIIVVTTALLLEIQTVFYDMIKTYQIYCVICLSLVSQSNKFRYGLSAFYNVE